MAARRPSARPADAGVDPPRTLPRPARPEARRRAARAPRARPALAAGALALPPRARAGRERGLEPDCDPSRRADRALRGDRRRAHHVAAQLRPPDRRGGEADDGRALGRGPAGLDRDASAPPGRARVRAREGAGERVGRAHGRQASGRDRRGIGRDRAGGGDAGSQRGRDDHPQRRGLRRLRRAGLSARRPLPHHPHRQLLREA